MDRHRDTRPPTELMTDLDDVQLRALFEYTNTTGSSPMSPHSNSHTQQHDQGEDTRRTKRRKLDLERSGSGMKAFRYGRFGEVEPGQLKMEIETCDGGTFADDETNPPESILKVDDTVYVVHDDFSCLFPRR